ncbi:hypothetical protein C8F04DRAFT_1252217 [Mycena alexandri]|uniref:Uncharacterized protein n=1 Tax=Mycena alexandri TaxID=1745969 RepID=A0AAD6TAV1_9AGAR|nr:hypothetical protein C8F04DRAFT_1252217 [Mycena alexandri]
MSEQPLQADFLPLSVYNQAAIIILQHFAFNDTWDSVLSALDADTLFELVLRSLKLFEIVMTYVRNHQPSTGHVDELRTGHSSDRFSSLPVELFPDVRFMQTVTESVLAGPVIQYLLDYSYSPFGFIVYSTPARFNQIIRFFEPTTSYTANDDLPGPGMSEGVDRAARFIDDDAKVRICVMCSISANALDPVTYSPFSHLMAAITTFGVFLVYPETATNRITFPNRECLDFGNEFTAARIIDCYRGFKDHFYYSHHLASHHLCGISWECPSTQRSTADPGCLHLFYPSLPAGCDKIPETVYPSENAMTWSLGGVPPPSILHRPILFHAMAPFPLLRHIQIDKDYGHKHFLVNAVHGEDFAATRDRSTINGSLWTFKQYGGNEVDEEGDFRDRVRPFHGHIFGRVDGVFESQVGYLVRLRCPEGASCGVQVKFDEQVARLREILADDVIAEHGPLASSWFWVNTLDVSLPSKPDCFYVWLPSASTDPALFNHSVVEMHAYTMKVRDFWYLPKEETQIKGKDYRCDVHPGLCCSKDARGASLIYTKLGRDFLPTRECSIGQKSLFTFKEAGSAVSWPTATKHGYSRHFRCLAFGEVVCSWGMSDNSGIAVELKCPTGATCYAADLFYKQVRSLQRILQTDCADSGGNCSRSWFHRGGPGDCGEGRFWARFTGVGEQSHQDLVDLLLPGKVINTLVSFIRVDSPKNPETGLINMEFSMVADGAVHLDEGDIGVKGVDYTCDRLKDGCQYCAKSE